jgi:hypothetical protein
LQQASAVAEFSLDRVVAATLALYQRLSASAVFEWIQSNAWHPLLAAAMMALGSAFQTNGWAHGCAPR